MDINWKGQVLPILLLEDSNVLEMITSKFNIKFEVMSDDVGLKYGMRNGMSGSTVKVLRFTSPKDNKVKSGIYLLLNFVDSWVEIYIKVEKESLTDEEVKEILFLALDECNM